MPDYSRDIEANLYGDGTEEYLPGVVGPTEPQDYCEACAAADFDTDSAEK